MKINKKQLLEILNLLKPAILNDSAIDNHNNFIFDNNKIIAYNDRIFIYHPFEHDFNGISVNSDLFYKLLSELKDEEIDLELNENKIVVKVGNSIANFNILNNSLDMNIIFNTDLEFKKLPDDFIVGLSLCSFSASKDLTKIALTAVSINNNKIASCDNIRLSEYIMPSPIDENFLISNNAVKELIKFKNINQYCLSDSWIYFKDNNDLVFAARLLNEKYPDYSNILEVDGIKLKLPLNELKDNIKLSNIFIDEQFVVDEKISIEIDNNKLICKSSGSSGKLESIIDIDGNYRCRCLKFSIHPQFFYQILDKLEINNIILGNNKILLESDNFKHVICLF